MHKWSDRVKGMYKAQPCPYCGYAIPPKEKRRIPISHLHFYECPQCKRKLYLKGGWLLMLYLLFWMGIIAFGGLVVWYNNYEARKLLTSICVILAIIGFFTVLIPILPIRYKD